MKIKSYLILALSSLIILGSCKKEKKDEVEKEIDPVAVKVVSGDRMSFDKNSFDVKKSQVVILTLKNEGKLPKEAMGHNIVVLKKGTDLNDFAMEAMKSKVTDYIPASRASSIIANTKTIGPGESTDVTFKIDETGDYNYICTFPGHHGTENGKVNVK